DISVIDSNEKLLRSLSNDVDVLTIHGSCTSISVLQEADIKNTDLFIAVTLVEEVNTMAAILAKKLGARKTIARIDDMEYLIPKNKPYLLSLGIDKMIYPEYITAKEVIGLVKQTGTSEIFEFSGGKLSLFVVRLDENAPVINKTLQEAVNIVKTKDYRLMAIARDDKIFIPKADYKFLSDDLIYIITAPSGIKNLLKYAGKKRLDVSNIMILGGGRIGKMVAQRLQSHLNVKLIEIDYDKCEVLANDLSKTLIINGDGRDTDFLVEEGIKNMDAYIAVTGNSEVNILSCVLAKKMGVKKAIAEVENLDFIDVASQMGIDTIVNKKMSAASHIYTFTMKAKVSSIKCLTGSDAEVLEFVVQQGARITSGNLNEINFPKGAVVGGVVRGEKSFIANGDSLIQARDKVVVFALPDAIAEVESFFN
ncbi:MAG: Trk system potassium transporter TrkA, partial [Bacteroidales bacterium]|nr:Trk system potassium transporter TrkA [Bacteroidales bacterium]